MRGGQPKSRDVNLAGLVSALPVARASQSSRLWPKERSWPLGFRSDVGWKLLIIAAIRILWSRCMTLESIVSPKIYLGTGLLYITHELSSTCHIEYICCQSLRSNDLCFKSVSSPVHADETPEFSVVARIIGLLSCHSFCCPRLHTPFLGRLSSKLRLRESQLDSVPHILT